MDSEKVDMQDTKDTYFPTKQQCLDAEQKIIDIYRKPTLTLFKDGPNAGSVHAVFTRRDDAIAYMTREAVLMCREMYADQMSDKDADHNETYEHFVHGFMEDNYELLDIDHVDPNRPIYKVQTLNYFSFGDPEQYLTNSLEAWTKAQLKFSGYTKQNDLDRWLLKCTVPLNPTPKPINDDSSLTSSDDD